MENLRVLLVMHELTMAGASRLALNTFRELKDDLDLRIVSSRSGALRDDFAALGELTVLREGRIPTATKNVLGTSEAQSIVEWTHGHTRSRLLRAGRGSTRPDVLYLNSVAALPVYAGLRWIRRLHCPTILHVHELGVMIEEYERFAPGLMGTVPDRYVVVSQAVADELTNQVGVPAERISVVAPRLEQRWVVSGPATRSVGADEPFVVGGVGIPGWTKGGDLWLLTASHLLKGSEKGRFRFRWIGLDDSLASRQFQAMARRLRLEDEVELLPFAEDPMPAYQSMDMLLVSSWEESASLVALEAMAVGSPVACFRGSGGPAELVGDTGVIVDEFSPAAMAEALMDVADSPERLRSLATAAHERVAVRYASPDRDDRILAITAR